VDHGELADFGDTQTATRGHGRDPEPTDAPARAPHCHLGLGRLYRRTGRREQAQEHLTTATAMYGEMGMTYWLEKLEKGMNALR
jgi:hypothetical protein